MYKFLKKVSGMALLTSFTVGISLTAKAAPSIGEIKTYYQSNSFDVDALDTYSIQPDSSSETGGELSENTRNNALRALNFARYIAGVDSVSYSTSDEPKTQAGTLLLSKIGRLDHYPAKPNDVSQSFYDLAYSGTSTSNLGGGYATIAKAIYNGWLDDGDSGNIANAGHRRWCLDPRLATVAFGHVGNYTAMYSFGINSGKQVSNPYVAWPAENMPVEFFRGPWSVSLTSSQYKVSNPSNITVTMTNTSNNQVYTINSNDKNVSGKYLNVSTSGFGYGNAVIFKPGVNFANGDVVNVKIDGLTDQAGNAKPLEYNVTFFSMNDTQTPQTPSTNNANQNIRATNNSNSPTFSNLATNSSSTIATSSNSGNSGSGSGSPRITSRGNQPRTSGSSSDFRSSTPKPSDDWVQKEDKWIFQNSITKEKVKQSWKKIKDKWYYFDRDGYMVTGWQQIDGKWYYMDEEKDFREGGMRTGWVKWKDKWFYLSKEEGSNEGELKTGWFEVDNKRYYLTETKDSSEGSMKTGWFEQDNKRYYLSEDKNSEEGSMRTGWLDLGNKRYYLSTSQDDSKGAVVTGWLEIDGNWYFFSRAKGIEGTMLSNMYVDGYRLGSDGARVSGKKSSSSKNKTTKTNQKSKTNKQRKRGRR